MLFYLSEVVHQIQIVHRYNKCIFNLRSKPAICYFNESLMFTHLKSEITILI